MKVLLLGCKMSNLQTRLNKYLWWTFNDIQIVKILWRNKSYKIELECICHCGKTFTSIVNNLMYNNTKSCWCITNATHWLSKHPLFKVYNDMFKRCYKWYCHHYHRYWWRWIKFGDSRLWDNWFVNFYNDMIEWYSKWLQIDRIDNDWDYCKENCRWATTKEQSYNKSTNLNIWWFKTYEIAESQWVPLRTVWSRKLRWRSDEEILQGSRVKKQSKLILNDKYLPEIVNELWIRYNIIKKWYYWWLTYDQMKEKAKTYSKEFIRRK